MSLPSGFCACGSISSLSHGNSGTRIDSLKFPLASGKVFLLHDLSLDALILQHSEAL